MIEVSADTALAGPSVAATLSSLVQPKPRPPLDKRGYKWIMREIEKLDPEIHYELIWALSTTYYVDDFFMNLLYTTGIQNFVQAPASSIIMIATTKKQMDYPQKRVDDTALRFWHWFEFGPSDINVQRSHEAVNQIHMALAKRAPGTFIAGDFIYTCCWVGADMHRLRVGLGVPGFTAKQKIAAHHFWHDMCAMFRDENGEYVSGFPKDFDGMVTYLEEYEARPWERVETGRLLAEVTTEQFAQAWFPWGLRWMGRQMILSLQKEQTRKLMRMGDPNPVARLLIRKLLWLIISVQEKVLPDPKQSTPEKARAMAERPAQHRDPPLAAKCPFPHLREAAVREQKRS
jgi:hypothetical protein